MMFNSNHIEDKAEKETIRDMVDSQDWVHEDEKVVEIKEDWKPKDVCYLESMTAN